MLLWIPDREHILFFWVNSHTMLLTEIIKLKTNSVFLCLHFLFPVQRVKSPRTWKFQIGWKNILRVGTTSPVSDFSHFCFVLFLWCLFLLYCVLFFLHILHFFHCISAYSWKKTLNYSDMFLLTVLSNPFLFFSLSQVVTSKETRRCTPQAPHGIPLYLPSATLNVPSALAR